VGQFTPRFVPVECEAPILDMLKSEVPLVATARSGVRQNSPDSPYFLSINRHTIMNTPALKKAQEYAEREIVARVDSVLPAYRVICDRLNARHGA
jgi:hypothetical protein